MESHMIERLCKVKSVFQRRKIISWLYVQQGTTLQYLVHIGSLVTWNPDFICKGDSDKKGYHPAISFSHSP